MINLDMESLIKFLKENESLVLSWIHNDELLAKKQNSDGLIIANASSTEISYRIAIFSQIVILKSTNYYQFKSRNRKMNKLKIINLLHFLYLLISATAIWFLKVKVLYYFILPINIFSMLLHKFLFKIQSKAS